MQIGTVKIESKLALAPMAGVTDAAFRQICSEKGAGYTVTELVSAKALCYHDTKTAQLLRPFPSEKPFAAQIFGSDVNCMAEAAQMAIEISGADILDINMGCPVGKVVKNGDGSAFLDKTAGDGIADTARASGADCFLALEQHGASSHRGRTFAAQRSGSRNRSRLHIGER